MSAKTGSVEDLFDRLLRKAPELLDLVCAETDEEFELAFVSILESGIVHLESNRNHVSQLQEEGLTAVIAGRISIPGLTVTQEMNANGHVDLVLEACFCIPARRKFGEAKIWRGQKYHRNGIDQLLRYMSGRDLNGFILNYVFSSGIEEITKTLRRNLDGENGSNQIGRSEDHLLRWSFSTRHRHPSGVEVSIDHFSCNLFRSEQ